MTPDFVAAYIGAIANGYKPAFEAVQTISPLDLGAVSVLQDM
jgi:hypothetical protein